MNWFLELVHFSESREVLLYGQLLNVLSSCIYSKSSGKDCLPSAPNSDELVNLFISRRTVESTIVLR